MDANYSDNLKMSSVQERLQLKRVPLDTWNIREQLCLASAVIRSGDQNWMSVSRALKTIGDPNRPVDWYSQKSCAAQYGALLEHVDTPKRKKRNSEGAAETPQESILKRLTQERIDEIQRNVSDMTHQCQILRNEISELRNSSTTDDRVKELWANIEVARKAREKETAKRAAWLREREERRARSERQWRVPTTTSGTSPTVNNTPTVSAPPSSPLLTSLLKSSPVVTTPQMIPHPAGVVDTISPSAGAPTLSMLLEKSAPLPTHASKHACIEHIKSQLVQLEHQLKVNTPAVDAPPVDIDDIVLNTEDVYAFRDIDLHLHPSLSHLPPADHARNPDIKPSSVKEEEQEENVTNKMPDKVEDTPKEQAPDVRTHTKELDHIENMAVAEPPVPAEVTDVPEPPTSAAFPQVKFPTPEIKVIQREEVKAEAAEMSEGLKQETEEDIQTPMEVSETLESAPEQQALEQSSLEPQFEATLPPTEAVTERLEPDVPMELEDAAANDEEPPKDPEPSSVVDSPPAEVSNPSPTPDVASSEPIAGETENEIKAELVADFVPECTPMDGSSSAPRDDSQDLETHTETDDDTPMELVREEEKDGKKKRDYSRKKKPDSRTCSGSESAAETSAPDSPGSTDDKQHRLWKKSVMLVYNRLCAHKYASLFLRPITDDQAPGYSVVVKRPMDLGTIKKNIDTGVIRTTAEFQRDVLLMLTNALMYNSTEHRVYHMTQDMFKEAESQLGILLAAQAHSGLPARTRRSRIDH